MYSGIDCWSALSHVPLYPLNAPMYLYLYWQIPTLVSSSDAPNFLSRSSRLSTLSL